MRTRLLAPLAVLVLVLAGAATAAAATGVFESNNSGLDSPRDIAERGTAAAAPNAALPETTLTDDNVGGGGDNRTEDQTSVTLASGATQTFAAGDAGSVTLRRDGSTLTVLSVNANAGFASEVGQGTGAEVEVQFNGTTRIDFNAELEDGAVRVRVRVGGVVAFDPTTPTTPEDNSGPGNAHEGDNNASSGPGNSDDSADDDQSGSGSGGSDNSGSDNSGSDNSGSDNSGSGHSGSGN